MVVTICEMMGWQTPTIDVHQPDPGLYTARIVVSGLPVVGATPTETETEARDESAKIWVRMAYVYLGIESRDFTDLVHFVDKKYDTHLKRHTKAWAIPVAQIAAPPSSAPKVAAPPVIVHSVTAQIAAPPFSALKIAAPPVVVHSVTAQVAAPSPSAPKVAAPPVIVHSVTAQIAAPPFSALKIAAPPVVVHSVTAQVAAPSPSAPKIAAPPVINHSVTAQIAAPPSSARVAAPVPPTATSNYSTFTVPSQARCGHGCRLQTRIVKVIRLSAEDSRREAKLNRREEAAKLFEIALQRERLRLAQLADEIEKKAKELNVSCTLPTWAIYDFGPQPTTPTVRGPSKLANVAQTEEEDEGHENDEDDVDEEGEDRNDSGQPPPPLSPNTQDGQSSACILKQTIIKQRRLARAKNTDLRRKVLLKHTSDLVGEITDPENGFRGGDQDHQRRARHHGLKEWSRR